MVISSLFLDRANVIYTVTDFNGFSFRSGSSLDLFTFIAPDFFGRHGIPQIYIGYTIYQKKLFR